MGKTRVLVAEDDTNILQGLIDIMDNEGYEVVPVKDGEKAIEIFNKQPFDLVVLDIMMPKKNGYEVCREIRSKNRSIPVVMLTAKGEEIDKVVGLESGADDYITKPFGVQELRARLAAVLRRARIGKEKPGTTGKQAPAEFRFGEANVDSKGFKVSIGKKEYEISERELKLLQYFYSRPDVVLSRDEILNAVWGVEYFGTTRTLDQHMAQLRKKIEKHPDEPKYLTTIHGVGYKYEP